MPEDEPANLLPYEDEIGSVEGPDARKEQPAGVTSPCFLSRFGPYQVRKCRGRSVPHADFSAEVRI